VHEGAKNIDAGRTMPTYDHLGPLAQRLGAWLARQCENGLPKLFGDELREAFPEVDVKEIKLALAELKADGLIELHPVIGPHLARIRTTYALFVAADPGITGNDPLRDAVVLARTLADDPKLGTTRQLEAAVGWERRRFNPALGQLMPLFPEGRRRNSIQNEYPTLGVIVGDDEIVALRRFIQQRTR
jgi:hypothetical protein